MKFWQKHSWWLVRLYFMIILVWCAYDMVQSAHAFNAEQRTFLGNLIAIMVLLNLWPKSN